MSQATDLIASVKARLAEVEDEVKAFEKDAEADVGHWTDLAQLRIAHTRLGLLLESVRNRAADLKPADVQEEPAADAKQAESEAETETEQKPAPKRRGRASKAAADLIAEPAAGEE